MPAHVKVCYTDIALVQTSASQQPVRTSSDTKALLSPCVYLQSSLMGPSLTIPVSRGRLALGTWQGVHLARLQFPL